MYQHLCQQLCEEAKRTTARIRPKWTGCWAPQNGGKPALNRTLLNQLLVGTEEQFHRNSRDILQELFERVLVFDDLEYWRCQENHDMLHETFRKFFRSSDSYPALVWATPTWFLMTAELPSDANVVNTSTLLQQLWPVDCNRSHLRRVSISLILGSGRPALTVPLDPILYFYPSERDRNPIPVRLTRERRTACDGRVVEVVTEDCISLARPGLNEDDRWLNDAKVPVHSHEGFFVRKPGNDPYLDTCVVTFASLTPDELNQTADVDYFNVFLHREHAQPLEISTSPRDLESFLSHHPGLVDALIERFIG